MLERLQKIISAAGITSRRASEKLILDGQVTVNGIVLTELGTKADPTKDKITVNGKPLQVSEQRLYILLNKPAGYMTTMDDPEGRALVTDLLKEINERVYPVGRLDYNTEGLLLLTNDGDWANKLMHPRHEIDKEYHVRLRGKVHKSQIDQLAAGVMIDDKKTAPATVLLIKDGEQNDWLSITIHEGRNRQIRRMCEAVSLSVVRLKRVRYGSLNLGILKTGHFRYLTEAEVNELLAPLLAPGGTTGKVTEKGAAHRTRAHAERTKRVEKKKYPSAATHTKIKTSAHRPVKN